MIIDAGGKNRNKKRGVSLNSSVTDCGEDVLSEGRGREKVVS